MYTVYIKTLDKSRINIDHINKIWNELNQIKIMTSDSSVETIFLWKYRLRREKSRLSAFSNR